MLVRKYRTSAIGREFKRLAPAGAHGFMQQSLALVSLVVRDYDEALGFYIGKLGFTLIEDRLMPEQGKRWVVVAPPGGGHGAHLLLARASGPEQLDRVGSQTGGRVFLFLHTDDFWRDHARFLRQGVEFVRPPVEQPYGTVAVFKDLYGNLWDLVQPRARPLGAPKFDTSPPLEAVKAHSDPMESST